MRKSLIIVLIALFLTPLFFLPITVNAVSPNWLHEDWEYQKSHVINNATGAGTDYQIHLTIIDGEGADTDDTMYTDDAQEDFDDIRFTDDDGNTTLNFWMYNMSVDNYANFWIKVNDNLNITNQLIYVYYGNENETLETTSDFDSTFIFGDPFDNATLDTTRWTSVDSNPAYTIDTNTNTLIVTNMDGFNWNNGKGFHSRAITYPNQFIIEDAYSLSGTRLQFEHEGANNNIWAMSINVNNHATDDSVGLDARFGFTDAWASDQNTVALGHFEGSEDYNQLRNGDQDSDIRIISVDGDYLIYEDANLRIDDTRTPNTNSRYHLGIQKFGTYQFGTATFGAFKIRKYASVEPTHGAWGEQEQSKSAYYIKFYNQTGGVFMVDGAKIANGTDTNEYASEGVIELQGIIAKNYTFMFFNYTLGYTEWNPYNFTVPESNTTIWLLIDIVTGGEGGESGNVTTTLFLFGSVNALPMNLFYYIALTTIGLTLLLKAQFLGKIISALLFAFQAIWISGDILLDTQINYISSYNTTTGLYQYANTVTHINTPILSFLIILSVGLALKSAIDVIQIREKRKD